MTEYLEKGDLFSYVKENGQIDEVQFEKIFTQITSALVHIHSKSILHRDIKLDNILLDKNLNVKLCDFGISKLMKPNKAITEHIGTPVYLAPEIISEKGYTGFAADIWSLGVTAYISLTGEVPFKGSTIGELKKNILLFKFSS